MANAQAVRGIPLNVSSQEDVTLPLAGMAETFSGSGVEYDGSVETVFYNDRMRQLIYKSPINGTSESLENTQLFVVIFNNCILNCSVVFKLFRPSNIFD